ncbi:MAG: DUF3471 domain-containing protein, partial [Gemmatimonadota bacterium]|nr:DUF3471 domain-containing protein [Gemmatimonadota bacterium]
SATPGGLRLVYGPGLQGPLEHWHYETFQVDWEAAWRGTALARFETGNDGSVEALILGSSRFPRADPR